MCIYGEFFITVKKVSEFSDTFCYIIPFLNNKYIKLSSDNLVYPPSAACKVNITLKLANDFYKILNVFDRAETDFYGCAVHFTIPFHNSRT